MGLFKKLSQMLAPGKTKVRVICVGLDNSGKSTLINFLKPKKAATTEVVPTVGFSVEDFVKGNLSFTVFDMSGQGRYRNLWEHYYKDCGGIIFTIDSTDKIRMCVARDELLTLLDHVDLKNVPIVAPHVFFANKMDLPTALSPVDCVQRLELDKITDKPWHIAASNALSGEGVDEGISWLGDQMARRQR